MYAVVGCSGCGMLWLLEDPDTQETATCPQCGHTHRTTKLRHLHETTERNAARDARAALLARRRGEHEAFAELPGDAELERAAAAAGIDAAAYLERCGVDPEAAREAGEPSGDGERDRVAVVRDTVRELDRPTAAAVAESASERGVPAAVARDLLDRLHREGEVTVDSGVYRLV